MSHSWGKKNIGFRTHEFESTMARPSGIDIREPQLQ